VKHVLTSDWQQIGAGIEAQRLMRGQWSEPPS
jgi:hypothetical protein